MIYNKKLNPVDAPLCHFTAGNDRLLLFALKTKLQLIVISAVLYGN